ncbi:MAG TPA: HGGxSTG domain-containing protein [Acetobacteraceae bacterium]|nr:HGGxSTG domain-containing protein [Acetobacteraceae bacterium]
MHREKPQPTGPLRNGNARGNPNLAPRCGATTRAGCSCRSPAMANGRCRMHGGASTGPRTAAGLAKASAAATRHGGYGVAAREHLRGIGALMAETRRILALHRAGTLNTEQLALRALQPPPTQPGRHSGRVQRRRSHGTHAP